MGGNIVTEGWITTGEAAELTGYHLKHVQRLARQGKVKARRVGAIWLVSRADLLAYKANTKPGPTPKADGGGDD